MSASYRRNYALDGEATTNFIANSVAIIALPTNAPLSIAADAFSADIQPYSTGVKIARQIINQSQDLTGWPPAITQAYVDE